MNGPNIHTIKSVGDVTLHAHVFSPDIGNESSPRPAIVLFFCGGWNGFNVKKLYPQSEYLASRGMVAINAEVRTIKEHGATPAECVIDARSTIRWARKNAVLWCSERMKRTFIRIGFLSVCCAYVRSQIPVPKSLL